MRNYETLEQHIQISDAIIKSSFGNDQLLPVLSHTQLQSRDAAAQSRDKSKQLMPSADRELELLEEGEISRGVGMNPRRGKKGELKELESMESSSVRSNIVPASLSTLGEYQGSSFEFRKGREYYIIRIIIL